MNDRYLFRGERIDNSEWVIGYLYITHNGEYEISSYNADFDIERMTSVVIPETVGQCTGLKDKNGKLIFEGDILEYSMDYDAIWERYREVVAWNEINCCWGVKVDDGIKPLNDWYWDILMLLGNIHDNPELLEEEND